MQIIYERSRQEERPFGWRELVQLLLGLTLWVGVPVALALWLLI